MKTLRFIFLLAAFGSFFSARSQGVLSVGHNGLDSLGTTHLIGSNVQLDLLIKNLSPVSSVRDTILLYHTINGVLYTSPDTSTGIGYQPNGDSISPSGSILKTLFFNFGGAFSVGPSVVVIWPIATHSFTYDSAYIVLNITNLAGVGDISERAAKAWMINDQLLIKTGLENELGHVRIYAVTGQLLQEEELKETTLIPMGRFPRGIYVAEVILPDNRRQVFKILNPGIE